MEFNFKGYVSNGEFHGEILLVTVDLAIIQEQLEIAFTSVVKHAIQLNSAMSLIIHMIRPIRVASQILVAVSESGLSAVNYHGFDEGSLQFNVFYHSLENCSSYGCDNFSQSNTGLSEQQLQ